MYPNTQWPAHISILYLSFFHLFSFNSLWCCNSIISRLFPFRPCAPDANTNVIGLSFSVYPLYYFFFFSLIFLSYYSCIPLCCWLMIRHLTCTIHPICVKLYPPNNSSENSQKKEHNSLSTIDVFCFLKLEF